MRFIKQAALVATTLATLIAIALAGAIALIGFDRHVPTASLHAVPCTSVQGRSTCRSPEARDSASASSEQRLSHTRS